jgi:L-alanine-DL-glutamate epimerase-like enolase superfamily enzyme
MTAAGPGTISGRTERLRWAREALGADVQLMMDAHCALTVGIAVRLGEAARDYWFICFEEPVLPRSIFERGCQPLRGVLLERDVNRVRAGR